MYHYVEDKAFINRSRNFCNRVLNELTIELRKNKNITSQFFLVGSGGRNMIAQNADEPVDFDYNLNIISCDDWNNIKQIKESVRLMFNKVLNNHNLRDVDDSTVPLTTKKMHWDEFSLEFSIDLCIVTLDSKGKWHRLIHEKSRGLRSDFGDNDRYYWNEAPNSNKYKDKVKIIKSVPGKWDLVRNEYIKLKNIYLSQQNYKPSFIIYIESVNNIYNKMKQKNK